MSNLDLIAKALKDRRSFCLSGHQNPDADVVGSQLAMASLLKRLDPTKEVHILNCGRPPKFLSYLPDFERVQSVERVQGAYDVLIVFECSGADRMGNIIDFKTQVKTVINIDHHLHNPNFGHINWVEPATSSTSELIFKIFQHLEMPLHKNEALCLYTGLVSDTGCFRYGNTNVQSHSIAAKLLEVGVPVADVSERLYMGRSKPAMALLSRALASMKLVYDDRVTVMAIPEKLYAEVHASSDDTEEIVNAGLQMESVVASILLKEKTRPAQIKISLRSKGNYDVNQVARLFGGGGHRNASGCTFQGTLEQAEQALLKEIERIFQ